MVIPRILVANCGESTIRAITSLKAKHAEAPENHSWGIDGMTGQVKDMKEVSFVIFFTSHPAPEVWAIPYFLFIAHTRIVFSLFFFKLRQI